MVSAIQPAIVAYLDRLHVEVHDILVLLVSQTLRRLVICSHQGTGALDVRDRRWLWRSALHGR